MRLTLAIAASCLVGCQSMPDDTAGAGPLGPITEPLPGPASQHHARVACQTDCLVARQVAGTVGFTRLPRSGQLADGTPAPSSHSGWNHPEIRVLGPDYLVLAATHGAPQVLTVDADGAVLDGPHPLHHDWPWALWPDVAVGEDGRAMAFWSDKITPWWLVFDPSAPDPNPQSFELSLDQATIDPPAVVGVPGGYVRGWTVKNGFEWQVRLQWTDLDGTALGPPVIAGAGEGLSRGARPQLAAQPTGEVAVAWRVWAEKQALPQGAFVRTYGSDQQPLGPAVRLDPDDAGDRPTVLALDDGWLAAWEHGTPEAVYTAPLARDGTLKEDPWPVSDAGNTPAGRAALALRPDGRAWISWEEVTDKRGDSVVGATVRLRSFAP